ncbi:MAG TPA: FG-GAP-like repeat-containing protein [Isosphaeraceae bacterium]|nr:FG-GAP-like repeat-containing protein [Isosphaeraceae bacterium]
MRRRLWIFLVGLLAACGGFWAFDVWRSRADWQQAQRDMARGKPASALPRLARLAGRWQGDGAVQYELGLCELALGHVDFAEAAWARVPSASPLAAQAAMMRARQKLKRHRLSDAEPLLQLALDDRGEFGKEARESLVHLCKLQGRYDEARRLVREGWGRYDRVGTIQELVRLDTSNPIPVEKIQPILNTAAEAAPDDDRIWLGWANLATRIGRFEVARKWLDACVQRRPADPAVWRVRLDWARAAENESEVRRALAHLPSDGVPRTELLSLGAWFARRAGDAEAERRALEELVECNPGALAAMESLAELQLQSGQTERAKQLRVRKGELEQTLDWYMVNIFPTDRLEHATELARAAEALGRRFEARCWWELAAEQSRHTALATAELARLDREETSRPSPRHLTPAGLLAELNAEPKRVSHSPRAESCGATPRFVDGTDSAGLHFTFDSGLETLHQMPETMSGGVALLDYDGDGWLDVYAIQGGKFPPSADAPNTGDRLFRNKGNGKFEDVTERSRIAGLRRGYGHGVTVGDIDNDGHPDLFLTRWQSYVLLRNQGDGTFEDITVKAGLGGDRDWPTSAAFADLDGDGDLDLYVCHYLKWDSEHPRTCLDKDRKVFTFCGPPEFPPMPDHLFRNDGGHFVDISTEAGIVDRTGEGLGVVANDLDGDGRVDLVVANDQSAKFLFLNRGGLHFEEVGHLAGIASTGSGLYQASMGIATGDLNGDGRPDVAVTNYYNEYTALYQNLGDGVFSDHSADYGLAVASRYRLGFGIAFLDFNNDGRLDLATANGHVDDHRTDVPQRMRAQLFAGAADGKKLVDVTDRAGPVFQVPLLGRGLAVGDLDNDGRVDLLILPQNQPLVYYHNQSDGGRSLTLLLEGTSSNRDAVGARVVVEFDGRRQYAWRTGGGSYQSASESRIHLGLGAVDRVDLVEVTWPSGRVDRYTGLQAGRGYRLREGDPSSKTLPGFRHGNEGVANRRLLGND